MALWNEGFPTDNFTQKSIARKGVELIVKYFTNLTVLAFAVMHQKVNQNSEVCTHHITYAPSPTHQSLSYPGNLWRNLTKWKFNHFSYLFHDTEHRPYYWPMCYITNRDYLQKEGGHLLKREDFHPISNP